MNKKQCNRELQSPNLATIISSDYNHVMQSPDVAATGSCNTPQGTMINKCNYNHLYNYNHLI